MILQALEEGTARIEQEQVPGGAPGETVKVPRDFDECLQWVRAQMWEPEYRPMIKVQHDPSVHTNQL